MYNKKRKFFVVILCVAILFVLSPSIARAESNTLVGVGTKEEPYQISSAEDLTAFVSIVNGGDVDAHAILVNDINLNGGKDNQWIPIGQDFAHQYSGNFNGQNHTISGLYIDVDSSNRTKLGLFGIVDGEGIVQNLIVDGTIDHFNRDQTSMVGGIAGQNEGTIQDCIFNGTIQYSDGNPGTTRGSGFIGGITGWNIGNEAWGIGVIANCTFNGTLDVTGYTSEIGGIAGNNISGIVTYCTNAGTVAGNRVGMIGGIIGQNTGILENCANIGSIESVDDSSRVGGIVGLGSGSIQNCYNTGSVKANGHNCEVGGIAGECNTQIKNCYNIGSISCDDDEFQIGNNYNSRIGGIAGEITNGKLENCYNTGVLSGYSTYVGYMAGRNQSQNTFINCFFLKREGKEYYNGIGTGYGGGYIELDDKQFSLQEIFANSNWNFDSIWQMDNELGRPILQDNPEIGKLENPYKISNVDQFKAFADIVNSTKEQIRNTTTSAVLMTDIDLSTVCGPDIDGSDTNVSWGPIGAGEQSEYTGVFDGQNHKISGLYINGGSTYVGLFGFVSQTGIIKDLTLENCIIIGKSNRHIGGIAGHNEGYIINCHVQGEINGGNGDNISHVGGVIGENTGGVLTDCSIQGTVSSIDDHSYVGGVVGLNSGSVKFCNVLENSIIKNNEGTATGGVIGYHYKDFMNEYTTEITNCYNTGSVEGGSETGGIAGLSGAYITNCYNVGDIHGDGYIGGLVGFSASGNTIINSYYLQKDGIPENAIGYGSLYDIEANPKSADAFSSGEITWLLQNRNTNAPNKMWGQNLGVDTHPILTDDEDLAVHKVIFDPNYDGAQKIDPLFTNGPVKLPSDPVRDDYIFDGWMGYIDGMILSEDITLTAQWKNGLTVAVDANPAKGGTVKGDGTYAEGNFVTVTATSNEGYRFVGWTENDITVSTDAEYKFELKDNRNLIANFEPITSTLSVTAPIFTTVTEGYKQPTAQSLTIANSGNSTANIVSVSVDDENFIILGNGDTVPGGESITSWSVQPVAGLTAGNYTATITVTYDNNEVATTDVNFTVEKMATPPYPEIDTPDPTPEPEPETPETDVTTNGENGITITTAKPEITIDDNIISAVVSDSMGNKILEQALENDTDTIFIAADTDSEIMRTDITISANVIQRIANDTDADLIISTSVGNVNLSNGALSTFTGIGEKFTVSTNIDAEMIHLNITVGDEAIEKIQGGITFTVPANTTPGTVAVIVHDDGTREIIRKSVTDQDHIRIPLDGSTTFEIIDNSKEFNDVSADAWYSNAVAFASSHELFNGTSATEFSPDVGMTRGMLATVLCNLERGESTEFSTDFNDVDADAWYASSIAWAVENGILNGYGNGTVGPNDLITREQMAAMLYNYANMLGLDTSARANLSNYSDAESISNWAEEVMSWANAEGIISGVTNNVLAPQGTATRAQVAAMLERFIINVL